MGARECPRCRLINDADSASCDCGYEFATGALGAQRAARELSREVRESVAETALAYRKLIKAALLQAAVGVASRVAAIFTKAGDDPEAVLVLSGVSIVLIVAVALVAASTAFRVAEGMTLRTPSAWAAGVFIAGILGVLVMNSRARDWFERHSIGFGLLGPKVQDIERFAARVEPRGRTTRS